jgi:hypothetical protein
MKEEGRRTTRVRLSFADDAENEIGSLLEGSAWQVMISGIAEEPKWRWTCHARDPEHPCTVVPVLGRQESQTLCTPSKHTQKLTSNQQLGWKDGEPSEPFLTAFSASSAIPSLSSIVPTALSCVAPLLSNAPQILNIEFGPPILTHFTWVPARNREESPSWLYYGYRQDLTAPIS